MIAGDADLGRGPREAGVRRLVYQSALGLNERSRETIPYYGAKWDAEEAVTGSGLEHVILRPSFVFGSDGGVLPTFARLARAPLTPIVGSGTQRIQPVWTDDMVEVLAASIDGRRRRTGRSSSAAPDTLDWNEFWERLKRVLGVRRPRPRADGVHASQGAGPRAAAEASRDARRAEDARGPRQHRLRPTTP